MTWRDRAAPIVRRVLDETRGQDEKAIRAALRAAYPFGERAYHPYKIWLDEIARQRGRRAVTARRGTTARREQEAAARTLALPGVRT